MREIGEPSLQRKKKKNGNCYEKLGTRLKGLEEWESDSLKVGAFFLYDCLLKVFKYCDSFKRRRDRAPLNVQNTAARQF